MDDRNDNNATENVEQLTYRLEALEKKVLNLEQQLSNLQPKQVPISPEHSSAIPETLAAPVHHGLQQPPMPAAREMPQTTPQPPTDWEHLIARIWLPRVFIAVLLIGVVWGFTAAVNAGYINEPVRCLLGILAAGLMYWWGEAQCRQNRHALGRVLLGGSIAVVLLSLFAAHMLYDLIPITLTFILYVLAIGGGLWTALRHHSQTLTVIIMIAGYLVPFLINSENLNIWSFVSYETLFSIAMLLLAYRHAYRVAYFTALGVLHIPLLIGILIAGPNDINRYPIAVAVLLQHVVLFMLSTFRHEVGKAVQTVSLFLSFGLTAAWMYGLLGNEDPFAYRLIIAICALIYSIASYWLYKRKNTAAVHIAIATFGWFLWMTHVLEASQNIAMATLVEGTLAIMVGILLKTKLQQVTGALVYMYGFFIVFFRPINEILSLQTLAWLVLLASISAIYILLKRLPEGIADKYKHHKNILLWIDSVLFLIFITQITGVATISLSSDAQHLLLSAVWVVYAIAVIVVGVVSGQKKVRLAGILFLFLTLVKIIFIDLPDVSTAVKAVLFIGLGSIGVAVSRLFYKRKNEPNE